MRYILGLCVVLAVGNSAWTSEMSRIAGDSEYQTPAANVTSSVTQTTGTTALPVTSPAGAYQTATSQPATTTMSPAPTMMSPGTYTTGTQPVAIYAAPMPNTPYTTYTYPVRMRGGLFGMRSPVYSYPAMPATTNYVAPAQTYTVMPGQNYYQPVRRRFGLFQHGASRPCQPMEIRSTRRQATRRLCIQRTAAPARLHITRRRTHHRRPRSPRAV